MMNTHESIKIGIQILCMIEKPLKLLKQITFKSWINIICDIIYPGWVPGHSSRHEGLKLSKILYSWLKVVQGCKNLLMVTHGCKKLHVVASGCTNVVRGCTCDVTRGLTKVAHD